MQLLSFSLLFLVVISSASTCLTSSEGYAAEVVVPQYDFIKAQIIGDKIGSTVFLTSQYDKNLLVLLSETDTPEGLSVRLQRPTEVREVRKPHIKLTSYAITGTVREGLDTSFYGWNIDCGVTLCTFQKGTVVLTAERGSANRPVTVEINEDLPFCQASCPGLCVTLTNESRCIDARTKQDMDTIVRYANISTFSQDLFSSYRITGAEGISVTDIAPSTTTGIDWQEAMREELVYLNAQNVITLSRENIEYIATHVQEGKAGVNYRLVSDRNNSWIPYNQIPGALLSSEHICEAYSIEEESNATGVGLGTFYLIPLILSISGILLLIVLVITARLLTRPRRKRKSQHNL